MATRIALALLCIFASVTCAASVRTDNFLVAAPDQGIAEQIGQAAEHYRRSLAIDWLGAELANWAEPCPIRVVISEKLGPGGETSFDFAGRRPTNWRMIVFGPLDRLLDSILPHEITHTVFATHFGRRLPPWVDEGACTLVEADSERAKLEKALRKVLPTERRLSFERMLAMKEYPKDVVPLYVQGHALSSYLIRQGGKQKFLQFVRDAMDAERQVPQHSSAAVWSDAICQHYGFDSLEKLEVNWLAWINSGNPAQELPFDVQFVSNPISAPQPVDEIDDMVADMESRM